MTDVARSVIGKLNSAPLPLCDDCLARGVGLPRRQQAQLVTSVLGETALYERYRAACGRCKDASKMVTAQKRGGSRA